ncbi:MAG: PD-(D/E)XK nuclease family protein [Proteobacteria bacterium]|nr:PD-(D/E)XK nuclease family protein [Pseudomonadota bacterium]
MSKEPKQLASYLEDILAVARSTSLRDIGEPLAGLQILSLTEARFVPSECLILVGCAEGIFPHSLPKDKLIDNSMLSAAKISGWRELEALEDTTFTLLASRIQDVIVTTPSNDGNGVRTKSRWLERLEIQGFKSESSPSLPSSLDKLLGFSKNPEEFSLDRPGLSLKDSSRQTDPDLEGILEDPIQHLKHFSASSLKAFLACPYQYLLRSKKVQSFELRDEDHPINLGSFAHKVIEYTLSTSHDHLINNDPIFATLPSSISHGHRAMFHEAALKRLRLFSSKVFPLDLQDTPFVLELMNSGWVAISDHWSSLFESGWNPKDSVSELTFGRNTDRVVCLEIGSHKVLITGAIDNFYQSPQGDWQINDYKLGKAPERSEVAKGLEPQLVLYSLCIDQLTGTSSNPSIQPSRGVLTYWSLGERTSKTIAVGKELDPALAAIFGKSKSSLEDLQSSLKQKWTEKIDNVISMGRFAADPSHCGYCEYENICRKNDPRHLDRILTQVGVES